jgi:hypothetical protein
MKSLVAVLVALVGFVVAAVPASAQTEITVFGGQVDDFDFFPRPIYNDDYVVGRRLDPGQNFDPANAAINALNVSNFYLPRGRSPFNLERAATLNRTGESLAEHQLRCQAIYDSYDLASDTYIAANGVPRPCRE